MEEKQCEGEKQALATKAKKLSASNSSSSSPEGLRRGRSRNRRALPPSSPLIIGSSSS